MFSRLKKMLIIVPCMIFGLFLFNDVSALAADAVLLESNKVVVSEENVKQNTYYFTNDLAWEFQAKFDLIKDYDTFLKYRVVRPDGKATAWSGKEYYVDHNGKFNIGNYTALSYTESVDISSRVSIAPAATYYVDIEYYGESFRLVSWNQNKGETLKIVVGGSDDSLNLPVVNLTYDDTTKEYSVVASILKDGVGYSAITTVDYYFSSEVKENNSTFDFYKNKEKSSVNGSVDFAPANSIDVKFKGDENDTASKYVYVIVTTGNGYSQIVQYDIENDVAVEDGVKDDQYQSSNNNDTGLFDYDFGELILLVLVVVLIVSCVLIIAQKIVDYKKKLY